MRYAFYAIAFCLFFSGIALSASAESRCPVGDPHPDSLVVEGEADVQKKSCRAKNVQVEQSPQSHTRLTAIPPEKPTIKKETPAKQQSFSTFSFLYYLFYKFNTQDFTATPSYTDRPASVPATTW